jgi:hypothetical protein
MTQHRCAGTKARFLTEFGAEQKTAGTTHKACKALRAKAHYGFSVVLGGFCFSANPVLEIFLCSTHGDTAMPARSPWAPYTRTARV